jgi:hypothetical protein
MKFENISRGLVIMFLGVILAIIGIFTDTFSSVLVIVSLLVGIGIPNLNKPLFIKEKKL